MCSLRKSSVKVGDNQMSSDRAVEWFRPLVGAQQWDYVVLWKLGNDPSRFIEWMGCCCSGGCDRNDTVKEDKSEKLLCRDNYLKHSVRTKACESLAEFPYSMPLYSGDHTEVVISGEPKWLSHFDHSESSPSNVDCGGTRALIPVEGGLIELYTSRHIPKDQKVMDSVLAHCKMISLEQETISPNDAFSLDSPPEKRTQKLPFSLHSLSLSPSFQALPPVRQSGSHASIEGSPSTADSVSCPRNEHLFFQSSFEDKSQCEPFKYSSERSSGSKRVDRNDEFSRHKAAFVSSSEAEKSVNRVMRKKEKGQYQSSNLLAERERRKKIKNGLLILRSLVPKITKMDMASIPRDAVNYIKELQMDEKELRDKIKEMEEEEEEEEDRRIGKDGYTIRAGNEALAEETRDSTTPGHKLRTDVEVNQIGERKYFIKLVVAHKRGGFVRLLEAIDSLKLQVVSINLTTLNGRVQNILEIKGERDIQLKKLRDLLIELTS